MQRVKPKIIILIAAIFIMTLCPMIFMGTSCNDMAKYMLYGYQITLEDVSEELLEDWDVELPENSELIYAIENRGFTGDGERYYIIQFEEEPTELISDFTFGPDNDFESTVENDLGLLERGAEQEIPTEYIPDWETDYLWKHIKDDAKLNYLYLLYYPESIKIIVLIHKI